jgi:hypothetical protein
MGSFVTAPPAMGTVKSCCSRVVCTSRCEAKRIDLPSGVKPSTTSLPGCHVSRFGSPPPLATT